jgi:hypothetical protein
VFKIDNPQEFAQALMHYIATEGICLVYMQHVFKSTWIVFLLLKMYA